MVRLARSGGFVLDSRSRCTSVWRMYFGHSSLVMMKIKHLMYSTQTCALASINYNHVSSWTHRKCVNLRIGKCAQSLRNTTKRKWGTWRNTSDNFYHSRKKSSQNLVKKITNSRNISFGGNSMIWIHIVCIQDSFLDLPSTVFVSPRHPNDEIWAIRLQSKSLDWRWPP